MTKLKYTPEIRERAVQLLIESEKDYPSTWAAITAIAPKIGCTPETLRVWYLKHLDQQNPIKVQQASDQEKKDASCEVDETAVEQASEPEPPAVKLTASDTVYTERYASL